ncbi:MAG: hypothetical protein HY937_02400 [Nitrosomonadales bacterium]|nr:hypothetical protein [Nitrosomonadales bacterium]
MPATKGGAYWFHQIGEELRAVQVAAGITPSTASTSQLLEAIQRLIDAQSGNYALDTGAANAYVVALSPAITAYTDGMTVRVKAANANTNASTLNAGAGVVALCNDVGGALAGGDVPAGGIFEVTYILSENKFRITSLVQSQGDARYAALAGLVTQVFSVATPNAASHAVPADNLLGDNAVINGEMAIDSRNGGAAKTITSTVSIIDFPVDRFYGLIAGASITAQRIAGSGPFKYALRLTGGAGNTGAYIGTRLKSTNCAKFTSQAVALSARLSLSVPSNVTWTAYSANSTDAFASLTQIATGNFAVTATPTDFLAAFNAGANAGNGILIQFSFGAMTDGITASITGVQLKLGSAPARFNHRMNEEQLCQAYHCNTYSNGVAEGTATTIGSQIMIPQGALAGYAVTNYRFPVSMQAIPTVTFYSPASGATGNWRRSAGGADTPVVVSGNSGISTEGCSCHNSSATVTPGEQIYGHIVADAEL